MKWNTERFIETTKRYMDQKHPLAPLAAGVHVFTQGFGLDPLIKDTGKALDGNQMELQPYSGNLPRTRQNLTELLTDLGVFTDVTDHKRHFRPFSAITKVINVVGDAVADGTDLLLAIDHGRVHSRQKLNSALAAS